MTDEGRRVIEAFEALSEPDRQVALRELLRCLPPEGDVPPAALDAAADELFAALDAEEAARGGR